MIPFLKMHGLGNDFVVLDAREKDIPLTLEQRCRIADRRRGIGCDQLIVLEPATRDGADVFMRIYNPDGSEAEACGNATRCVADLIMQEAGTDNITVETVAGLLPAVRESSDMGGGLITVDMGPARLDWDEIPLAREMDTAHLDLSVGGYSDPAAVSMGNPHCIFFVPDAEAVPLSEVGPAVENHELFPRRTNVEFASLRQDGSLRLRVWERGAGITQACGSGACATAVAAVRRGIAGRNVAIELDGGILILEWREEDGHVLMTGPVALSFTGEIEP